MKKVLFLLVMIIFLPNTVIVSAGEESEESETDSAAYILVEDSTGTVLSESNADERLAPASLTKIMVLLLAAEEINAGRLSLEEPVAVSAHASQSDGSVIWLEPGEIMSVADLFKAVIIASANDASVALAEHIAGTEDAFVKMMNQKAYVLGMTNTNFNNAAGFDHPDHYTSARDAATMSRAFMRADNYALFSENMLTRLSSVRTGTERETQLLNTNKLITYYNGIEGIKTGTTDNAGFCLSAAATRNEMRLISVVMGCKDNDGRVDLSEKLLDYGFGNYELYRSFGNELEPLENLIIQGGVEHDLKVILAPVRVRENQSEPGIVIPKGRAKDIEYDIYLPESVSAPISRNQPVGTVTAKLDGKVVYESYITAAGNAYRLTFGRILSFLTRRFFI
ncbi:MAG: D-alanyl-D-alanine carboxypeptidase [Oscillospiraceae bacterium]|nr:D-alanyl-D-alanine carboxypeptidase [Oscillospiraceae bacterium]